MNDTKFTKGPWVKDKRNENLAGGDGECVKIWGCGLTNAYRSELTEANANLIAAAPDMYAALESHLSVLDDLYPSDATDISEAHMSEFIAVHNLISKTKYLLKKARGE